MNECLFPRMGYPEFHHIGFKIISTVLLMRCASSLDHIASNSNSKTKELETLEAATKNLEKIAENSKKGWL